MAYVWMPEEDVLWVLPMGVGEVLQTKGTQVPHHHSGTPKPRKVPCQRNPQPKIQCAHLPTHGFIPAVQVFPQSVLFGHGYKSVYS